MITAIENCLIDTCVAIGIALEDIYHVDDIPETLPDSTKSYAQFQLLDSIYAPISPSVLRKIDAVVETETTVKTPRAKINLTARLGLIDETRSTVETRGIDFIENLSKTITWDSDPDIEIKVTPTRATRGDYIESVETYKELAIYLEFDSVIYKVAQPTEYVITTINEIGKTYDNNTI